MPVFWEMTIKFKPLYAFVGCLSSEVCCYTVRKSTQEKMMAKDNQEIVASAQDKLRFTVKQLADGFGFSAATVRKRLGGTPPVGKRGNYTVYLLRDIAELIDVRDPYVPQEPDDATEETDPDKMSPKARLTHYQAEDVKQASEAKHRKNMVENRQLVPAELLERSLAQAFKTVALVLDTLPDALERDGVIASSDVQSIIRIVDSCRDQLANDMSSLAPEVVEINDSGDW